MTALKRRIQAAHLPVEEVWLNAWTDWAAEVMRRWQSVDPQARRRHDTFIQPLYLEWVSAVQGGELPTFLARGTSLAKWWPSAPLLWDWLWTVQQGWLEHDLRKWPNQLPEVPAVPAGVTITLVQEVQSVEDVALLLAVLSAQGGE